MEIGADEGNSDAAANVDSREENPMPNPSNPLRRSRQHRMIAGVCGGLAEWLGWDPTVLRIVYVVVSIASAAFPGILAYVILWILMPEA
jgi:phage shock protein PspC (stress-responsive transcriptional regulator)